MNIVKKIINEMEINFLYREESTGDTGVIGQVLDGRCFDIERWHQGRVARGYFDFLLSKNLRPLIIDAGANIGASSIFFGSTYKTSKIIAIEPEKNNTELLKINVKSFSDASVIEGAIGAKPGSLFLQDPGLSDWGFRVGATGDYEVPVFTIDHILEQNKSCVPFIAKIDIEGGELTLFDSENDWFNKFAVIIFETHDWMLPFKGVSKGLIKEAAKGQYDMIFRGENLFFFNHKFLLDHHNPF